MSRYIGNKIAYWFFLIIGMLGITMQLYKWFNDSLELTFSQGIVTAVFVVFIFRPKFLLEVFNSIVQFKLKK